MSDDMGILDAISKVCIVCMICAGVVFGALNLWSRYVRYYQQSIGMEAEAQLETGNNHETPIQRFHAR